MQQNLLDHAYDDTVTKPCHCPEVLTYPSPPNYLRVTCRVQGAVHTLLAFLSVFMQQTAM